MADNTAPTAPVVTAQPLTDVQKLEARISFLETKLHQLAAHLQLDVQAFFSKL